MSARSKIVRDFSGQEVAIPYDPRDDAQHTPGPWTVDDCPDADGYDTIRLADGTLNGNTEAQPIATAYSHAALIAAAPAMLEALKAVESEITRLERISKQAFSIDEVHPAVDRVAIATRAAIAAAEGK